MALSNTTVGQEKTKNLSSYPQSFNNSKASRSQVRCWEVEDLVHYSTELNCLPLRAVAFLMEKSAICGLGIVQLTMLYSFSVTKWLSPDGFNLLHEAD